MKRYNPSWIQGQGGKLELIKLVRSGEVRECTLKIDMYDMCDMQYCLIRL